MSAHAASKNRPNSFNQERHRHPAPNHLARGKSKAPPQAAPRLEREHTPLSPHGNNLVARGEGDRFLGWPGPHGEDDNP